MASGKSKLLLLLMTGATLGVTCATPAPAQPPRSKPQQPHIILIVADDVGWNDVSWHNPLVETPQLEALARSGVVLEQSYVQHLCSPTRSALLTGRYPFTIGRQSYVIWEKWPTGLDLNLTLLPQSLKAVGYSTHAVGKWHLGFCSWAYTPLERGFDTFYGFYSGGEYYYSHIRPPIDISGDDLWASCEEAAAENVTLGYDFRNNTEPDLSADGTYSTYLFSSYVEKLLSSLNPEAPMFLYLAFQSVHFPNEVPEIYTEPYSYVQDEQRRIKLGMLSALDEAVGRVVTALKDTGHYDNSVIVFTTDNGGPTGNASNNWPLRGTKSTLWEGGTRGVAFLHSPLLPNSGTVSHQLMHVTDWFKTLVGLAGATAPPDTDGVDQWAAITGSAPSPRTHMIYNIENNTDFRAGVRMGDYKLLVGDPGSGEWTYPPENSSFTTDINLNIEELTDIFESQHHITQSDPRHLRAVDFSQNQPGLIEASVSFDHTHSGPTQASAGLDHTQSGPIQASTGLDHTHSGPTQANVDLDHTQSSPTQANVGAYHSQSGPTQASVGADHTQSGPIQASASLDHTQSDPIHANVHIDYTKPNLMKLKELEIIEKENSKMLESDKISKYLLDADGGVSGRLLISRGHPASGHSGNTQEGHMSGGHLASGHSGNTQEGHMSGGHRASDHSGNTQEGHMSGGHRASGHSKDTHERQGEGQLTIQQLLQYLNTNITEIRLYNITADPEERVNLAEIEEGVVVEMLYFLLEQMSRYVPADIKSDDPAGDPSNFNNIWTPGWCDP